MRLTNYCVYLMHNPCEIDTVVLNDPPIQMVFSYTWMHVTNLVRASKSINKLTDLSESQ